MINSKQKHRILAVTVGLVILSSVAILQIPNKTELKSLIVQGTDIASVKVAVSSVGGEITHELGIINAVSAHPPESQRKSLKPKPTRVVARIMTNSSLPAMRCCWI